MGIQVDIGINGLKYYLINQLNYFFPDGQAVTDDAELSDSFEKALSRLDYCFKHIVIQGYWTVDKSGNKHPFFQHTNSDQYCQFLWFLSNTIWKCYPEKKSICDKIILLNKALHGCWYTYKVELPDIFILIHPVGSVIGHAHYSNFLVVCQNVTIGQKEVGDMSTIGEYCFLGTGATIMGACTLEDNVSLGIHSVVYNEFIEKDSVVYTDKLTGERKIIKTSRMCRARMYFDESYHH